MSTIFRPVISLPSTIRVFGYMGECLIFLFNNSFNAFQVFFVFLSYSLKDLNSILSLNFVIMRLIYF